MLCYDVLSSSLVPFLTSLQYIRQVGRADDEIWRAVVPAKWQLKAPRLRGELLAFHCTK